MKRFRAFHVFSFATPCALALAAACSSGTGGTGGTGAGGGTSTNPTTTGTSSSSGNSSSGNSSSGTTTSGTTTYPAQTGVCKGAGTRALTTSKADAFIDDFEEAMISPGWSSFNDVTPANSFLITQVAGGAVNTAHSGNYMGTGAKTTAMGGYGVGAVYNTAIDPTHGIYCVDVSVFTGVSFWAKAATAGSMVSLNFVLPNTNAASANDAGVPTGGDCTTNCYNHPRISFTLTADWAQYTAPFAAATGGSAKVENVIQELAWLSPDSDWNFSIDEIAFYAGTPPTGAVAP
jgi:hypothetical protein